MSRTVYKSMGQDSTRWDGFEFRQGDIVITTPPKAGTTWMQMICALLIFQKPALPRPLGELSPWLDLLTAERDEVFAELAAQNHRRFIKSHTPLDGLPVEAGVTYICVGRDPRDIGVSLDHHRANFEFGTFLARRTMVAGSDDVVMHQERDPQSTALTLEGRFWDWVDSPVAPEHTGSSLVATLRHFEEALRTRSAQDVVVFHYSDLKADLPGQMRRLAQHLDIDVLDERWPSLVEAASFGAMRRRADELIPNPREGLFKTSEQFFHSGTGGQWRAFFDTSAEARYQARVAELTSPEVAAWAHGGGSALGST